MYSIPKTTPIPNNYKQKRLYCTMIQKIYDSIASERRRRRHRPYNCTDSTKAHKKYSVLYTRLLAHMRPFFGRGCFFIFSSIQGANEPESTSISHSTNATASATAHPYHPIHPSQNHNKPYT